ncbi:MAG: DNA helicase RecQ [Sumerlaeia bacterium]
MPTSPSPDVLIQHLRERWGYEAFRPLQREAMDAVMAGRDSLVILPTGGGKSLCFQVPALALEGLAVVVSPLISLMTDQVDALRELGVAAGKLHSGQDPEEARAIRAAMRSGELKLLYVSPERLVAEGFDGVVEGAEVSFLAIDEAHCVSEWGHDFRPEYRQLAGFRELYPRAALHCYTATATPAVAQDIARQLGLRDPAILCGSFDRPNLTYRVERRRDVATQVIDVANRHRGESGIVYCISRRETERVAEELVAAGIRARAYHAGLDPETRADNQRRFIRDEVTIIVATIAFGMGIDKPDVRFVVHAGMPKSLENYQQESGRAGRDGLEAECVLLYSGGDVGKWSTIIGDQPEEQRRVTWDKLNAVQRYAEALTCRRAVLLGYFGETYGAEKCDSCDVCEGTVTALGNGREVAQMILSSVVRQKFPTSPAHTTAVLTGGNTASIREAGHQELSTYGLLRQYSREAVRGWITQLVMQGHLGNTGDSMNSPLRVTDAGWRVLKGEDTARLVHHEQAETSSGPGSRSSRGEADWQGVERPLFDLLRGLRRELAEQHNVPPYMVFGDQSLREMARCRPTELEGLRRLHGVGEKKLETYGEEFLQAIAGYCHRNPDLAVNDFAHASGAASPVQRKASTRMAAGRAQALRLLREGASLDAVAQQTGRARSTVEGDLETLIRQDRIGDPTLWVDPDLAVRIEEASDAEPSGRLRPIHEALDGEAAYWQIRLVRACRAIREEG